MKGNPALHSNMSPEVAVFSSENGMSVCNLLGLNGWIACLSRSSMSKVGVAISCPEIGQNRVAVRVGCSSFLRFTDCLGAMCLRKYSKRSKLNLPQVLELRHE